MAMFKKMIIGSNKNKELPPNRFLQFFYIIKENFLLLFYCSITYFVFILPLIYCLLSSYLNYTTLLNSDSPDSTKLFNLIFTCGVLLIPCILLSSIGEIGIYGIIKKLVYDEACLYKDFFKTIKIYFKKGIVIYVLIAIFTFLLFLNYGSYLYLSINPIFKLIAFIVTIILFSLFMLIKPFYLMQVMNFENDTLSTIKNSFTIMFSKLFLNIAMNVLSCSLYITLFFFTGVFNIIFTIIIIVFGGAFSTLINYLNTISVIEKVVDKENLKELYKKGLKEE